MDGRVYRLIPRQFYEVCESAKRFKQTNVLERSERNFILEIICETFGTASGLNYRTDRLFETDL